MDRDFLDSIDNDFNWAYEKSKKRKQARAKKPKEKGFFDSIIDKYFGSNPNPPINTQTMPVQAITPVQPSVPVVPTPSTPVAPSAPEINAEQEEKSPGLSLNFANLPPEELEREAQRLQSTINVSHIHPAQRGELRDIKETQVPDEASPVRIPALASVGDLRSTKETNNVIMPERSESYWENAKKGAVAQGAGALGGLTNMLNVVTGGRDGEAATQYLENVMAENARKNNPTWESMKADPLGYIKDPEGLAYDASGAAGSSAALIGTTLLAKQVGLPIVGSLVGGGAFGATAGLASTAVTPALAVGLGTAARAYKIYNYLQKAPAWLTRVMDTPAGKVLLANVASTPLESLSEGGNAARDIQQAGGDINEQQKAALKSTALNMALLTFTNTIESTALGKVIDAMGGKNAFISAMGGWLSDAVINAYEEGAQQTIQQFTKGETDMSAIPNPWEWNPEAQTSSAIGFVGGGAQGAVTTAAGRAANKYLGKKGEESNEAEPSADESMAERLKRGRTADSNGNDNNGQPPAPAPARRTGPPAHGRRWA